jgi:ZipA, C-terminal FtsZ-binding domain
MTDLQLGLLLLGAAAVIGVVAYNYLQERKVRREAQRAFGSAHEDVLLGRGQAGAAQGRRPAQADAMPDEKVDYIMLLRSPVGVPGATVIEGWRPLEQRFGRRALLAGSDGSGWRRLAAGDFGSYGALRAALQLVSRDGVVSDAELVEFRAEVETLASRLGAAVSAPEMRQALEAARELDRRCADADAQVALHVVGELAPEALDAALAETVEPSYQLTRRADGLTLVLDVPRTPELTRAYEAMTRAALQLAANLGGRVVDDRGNALDERALAAIGAELEPMRRRLVESGIEPGSPLAARLFS